MITTDHLTINNNIITSDKVSIGSFPCATECCTISIGKNIGNHTPRAIAIGNDMCVSNRYGRANIAIGECISVERCRQTTVIGSARTICCSKTISVGTAIYIKNSNNTIAIGNSLNERNENSIHSGIGIGNDIVLAPYGIGIGEEITLSEYGIAMGNNTTSHDGSIAIGYDIKYKAAQFSILSPRGACLSIGFAHYSTPSIIYMPTGLVADGVVNNNCDATSTYANVQFIELPALKRLADNAEAIMKLIGK